MVSIYKATKDKENNFISLSNGEDTFILSMEIYEPSKEKLQNSLTPSGEVLKISIYLQDSIPRITFTTEKTLPECKESCIIFSLFQNLKGIMCAIEKVLLKNNFNILVEDEKITLVMKFSSDFFEGEVNYDLFPVKRSTEEDVKALISEVNNLRIDNKKLKAELEELKKNVGSGYDKVLKCESLLLPEEKELIAKWINPDKNISFNLLYKATSSNGESASNFHSYCNNKGATLTVIMSRRGNRFGGYTSVSWTSYGDYVSDNNAFIFSLDNKEKYKVKNGNEGNAIYDYSSYGPTFGGGQDIYVSNNCFLSKGSYCNATGTYYENASKEKLTGGQYYFLVEDYEVYQVTGL